MELPDVSFKENDYHFNHVAYAESLELPPFNNDNETDNIPFEEIKIGQYEEGARMNSFKTDKAKLPLWIKSLTLRYWETLGKMTQILVRWEFPKDKCKHKNEEIMISVEKKVPKKTKLFVIKVYTTTGTITIQGNYFTYFGSNEFPALKSFVDTCYTKPDGDESVENTNQETQSETTVKQIATSDTNSESPNTRDKVTSIDSINSDSSDSSMSAFNETLIDVDLFQLNQICHPRVTPNPRKTRRNNSKTENKVLEEKLQDTIQNNKALTLTIQKLES